MHICDVSLVLGLLSSMTSAQITIMSPKRLASVFADTYGYIPGSTAAFGTPYYGERLLGALVWGEPTDNARPHCTEEDYTISFDGLNSLAPIFVVSRGGCSFVMKVKVAEAKGAKAVLIVDKESSGLTRDQVQYVVMADDGWGTDIKIPSILLCAKDGKSILKEMSYNKVEPPVVELSWLDLHQLKNAKMDLWTSPGVYSGLRFLQEYAAHARVLGPYMHFQPHYHVVSLHLKADDNKLCIDGRVDLCTEDPDREGPVTGEDILYESVRQWCIWDRTEYHTADPAIRHSAKFWDYVEKLPSRCSADCSADWAKGSTTCSGEHLGRECSEKVMKEVAIDIEKIQECIDKDKYTILEHERDNHAWNIVALRINDWRYSGPMSPEIVTRAICSSFFKTPDACRQLLEPVKDNQNPHEDSSMVEIFDQPVSAGELIGGLALVLLFLCCCGVVARKIIIRNTRESMRYEIMNEVKGQIRASGTGNTTSI